TVGKGAGFPAGSAAVYDSHSGHHLRAIDAETADAGESTGRTPDHRHGHSGLAGRQYASTPQPDSGYCGSLQWNPLTAVAGIFIVGLRLLGRPAHLDALGAADCNRAD